MPLPPKRPKVEPKFLSPAEIAVRLFLSGIKGLVSPLSLREQASRSLHRYYNANNCLPPVGWFSDIECDVLVGLKPTLFLDLLHMRGGVLQLKRDYTESQFELVLKKMYALQFDFVVLPLRMRSRLNYVIQKHLEHMRSAHSVEHAFYSLGLCDRQEVQHRDALCQQQGDVERENANPNYNHRILSMYIRFNLKNLKLVLPPSKSFLRLLKSFEPEQQKLFLRGDTEDARKESSTHWLSHLEEYLKMKEPVKFCALLQAIHVARLKKRPHVALYLCLYILFEIKIVPEHCKYKSLIYRTLVESLSAFNCRYDLGLEILSIMEKSVARESDYLQFILAKQRFFSVNGFNNHENILFERCFREELFLRQSTHFVDFLENHANSILKHCHERLVFVWGITVKVVSNDKEQERKKITDNLLDELRDNVNRQLEIFSSMAQRHPNLPFPASGLAKEVIFRARFLKGALHFIRGQKYLAGVALRKCLKEIPSSLSKKIYQPLLEAFCAFDNIDKINHLLEFRESYVNRRAKVARKLDWQQSLEMADFSYEILAYLLGTNLFKYSKAVVRELHAEALESYSKLSVSQLHPRVPSLKVLDYFFGLKHPCAMPRPQNVSVQATLASNLELCELTGVTTTNSILDTIRFYFGRDGEYLNSVASFGYQSVACNAGI